MTPPLLTIDQAAEHLRVTRRFVERLVHERRITFVKVGKFVRFRPADLDAFIEAGVQTGQEWRGSGNTVRLHPRRRAAS